MTVMFTNDEPKIAEVARHLNRTVVNHPEQIEHVYCSLDWWGGSGSMADFIPADDRVRRRHLQLLVALVQAFERHGYHCPRARSWIDIFSNWLQSGVV
jgi:hypothetical protein